MVHTVRHVRAVMYSVVGIQLADREREKERERVCAVFSLFFHQNIYFHYRPGQTLRDSKRLRLPELLGTRHMR